MFANTLILSFTIAMTAWWALAQGFFSAFLQLMVTVLAAVLAVALWEPLAAGFFSFYFPNYAWGVGLLGPFILWLVILRIMIGILVPSDIELGRVVNIIGGGACGLLSAILASGVTVLGIGFLPLPPDAGGYRPMVIQEKWRVAPNTDEQLWLPVDRYVQSFLTMLSAGSLSNGAPLAQYQPELIEQAALFRMRYNPNSALVAIPDDIQIKSSYSWPLPIEGIDAAFTGHHGDHGLGRQLVLIDTHWQINRNTLDADGMLRAPPTQIRLVTTNPSSSKRNAAQLHAPVGWIQADPDGQNRRFTSFDSSAKPIFQPKSNDPQLIGWVFILPVETQARFVIIRRVRHRILPVNGDRNAREALLGLVPNDEQAVTPSADR